MISEVCLRIHLSRFIWTSSWNDCPIIDARVSISCKFFPVFFYVKWNIFRLICSFMFRFFAKLISSCKRIFDYKFDIKENSIVNNPGRFIWALPNRTTQKLTSEYQNQVNFLPLVFYVKCNIFCLICSFMFWFFEK